MDATSHIVPERLVAYFDGELSHEDREAVARHVASCRRCQGILDDMAMARIALHTLPSPVPSEALWKRVEAALPGESKRLIALPRRARYVAVAASVLVAALTALLFLQLSSQPSTRSAQRPALAVAAPFNWGLFLNDLDHPLAEPRLTRAYTRQVVSLSRALEAAGVDQDFRPERLPADLQFEQAYLLRNGTSEAAQLVYQGRRGPLFLFCQSRDEPVSFTGFKAEATVIDETPCYSVYCSGYRALSVSTDQGTYTLVGRRGDPVLPQVLEALVAP